MKRILAISDIHGELNKFNKLLEKIEYDPNKDQLVLLGDYVDRGPDSRGVLNKVMELRKQGAIVLRGNHDDMLVGTANGDQKVKKRWSINVIGAIHTLQSYDSSIKDIEVPEDDIFKQHVTFIESLDYFYETEDYIFVHGGVDPDTSLDETDPYVLIWIRDKFHNGYEGEKTVIFGHTRTTILHEDDNNTNVYFGSNNIIGIDGGAVYEGSLNCLELPSQNVYSVK